MLTKPAGKTFDEAQLSGSPPVQFSKPEFGIWALVIRLMPKMMTINESKILFIFLVLEVIL
jgi:hypothetical protein